MSKMRFVLGLLKAAMLLTFITVMFDGAGYAQTARKFGNSTPIVRLCPATCVAVNGHGFKPGGTAQVYETRAGWARVSGFLDRAKLVASFGNSITQKPALWVAVSQLASNGSNSTAKPKAKAAAKQAPRSRRTAQRRRVTLPTFRPGTVFSQAEQPAEKVQTAQETTEEQPATETPAAETPAAETVAESKPVVVDSTPLQEVPQAEGTRRTLTWEELQAKLAAQAANANSQSVKSEAEKAAEAERAKEAARIAAKEAEARKAAEAAAKLREEKRLADLKAVEKAEAEKQAQLKQQAQEKQAADAAKAAEAQKAAEAAAAQKAKEAAAAKKIADEEAAKAKLAASEKKAATEKSGEVAFSPPKAPEASNEEEVAVVLPPTAPAQPLEENAAAKTEPIVFGARPKKLTKALLDKRLSKLPGRKSRVRKDVVIALRHYALGLLNSGECKGIAKGGPSSTPGMLYVACTEDPSYLRQFSLEEESW